MSVMTTINRANNCNNDDNGDDVCDGEDDDNGIDNDGVSMHDNVKIIMMMPMAMNKY
jgi:hypothetical protein